MNPNNPTPPTIDPGLGTTPPVQLPTEPLQPHPEAGMSGSQLQPLRESGERKKKLKKLLLGIPIVLVAILIVWVGVVQGSKLLNRKFTGVNYDNGSGVKASLKYYRDYEIKPASELGSLQNGSLPSTSADRKYLVSPDVRDNGLRLALAISKIPRMTDLEVCKNPAFTVSTKQDSEAEPVCKLIANGDKPVIYVYQFTKGEDAYLCLILLDYDLSEATTDQAKAKQVVDTVDLRPYNNDIKTILSSIEVK